MNTPRYTEKTVQKFLDYLNEIGLSVYGQAMNDKGENNTVVWTMMRKPSSCAANWEAVNEPDFL